MKIFTRKRFLIGAGLVVLAAGVVLAVGPGRAGEEYPDAPFAKVGPDFPRIIEVSEPPLTDAAAQGRYRQERQAVLLYLKEGGAMRRATAGEQAAVRAVLDGNYPRGREEAEKVLKKTPDSVPALYAYAAVQFYGEENLPQALFRIRKVRHLLERRGRDNSHDADSREWYIRVLDLEYLILKHLDRSEDQLRVVELLAQVYQELPWLKVWPLIKLQRHDEAQECIDQTLRTGRWKLRTLNDQCCLAAERRQRLPAFRAGERMVKAVPRSAVLWSNFAETATGVFRLEQAEEALRESARLADLGLLDFYGSPHRSLSRLYLQQGRFPEAWAELKKGKAQRDRRPPFTLDQDQGRMDRTSALFLLALGHGKEAYRFARRAHERPDRRGNTSTDQERDDLSNKLVLGTALRARIEQLREEDAAQTGLAGLAPDFDRRGLEFEAWALKRQLLKLLGGLGKRNEFRPYLPGNAAVEPWLVGSLIQVLPAGIATVAIRQARAEEDHPGAAPYFDAFEAEAALARGQAEEALRLARQALDRLPLRTERLLRARTAAVAAEAARRLGRDRESLKLLTQAVADFPQVLRLLNLTLPVRVEDDGTPLARQTARRLLGSPRFREEDAAFRIVIRRQGSRLTLVLFRPGGVRHCQASVPARGEEDEVIAAALKEFHQKLMSPALDLTPTDINSLDGSEGGAMVQDVAGKALKKAQGK